MGFDDKNGIVLIFVNIFDQNLEILGVIYG